MPFRDAWIGRRRGRPRLAMVIYDCDGVLIDSEAICNRIVAEVLTELGWPMTAAESHERFIGLSFYDTQPIVESRIGRSLGSDWVDQLVDRVVAAMTKEVELVPGALVALNATERLGLPWRIASNSSHTEMDAKFTRVGITAITAGRTHSAEDVIALGGRGKPAPDVYLAAARAQGVDPAACLVIEDSVAGITAALTAGMDCLAYSPDAADRHLLQAGATPFRSMHDLPALLRLALDAAP